MSEIERIETLIPYKEMEFRPTRKLGKLNPERDSAAAAAAKLGRHLISGLGEGADLTRLAIETAARLGLDRGGGLEPWSPEEGTIEAVVLRECPPDTMMFRSESGGFVVVGAEKIPKKYVGETSYRLRSAHGLGYTDFTGFALPCAVGALEICEEAGEQAIEGSCQLEADVIKLFSKATLNELMAHAHEVDKNGYLIHRRGHDHVSLSWMPDEGFWSYNWRAGVAREERTQEMSPARLLGLRDFRPETLARLVATESRLVASKRHKETNVTTREPLSRVFMELAEKMWFGEVGREELRDGNERWAAALERDSHSARVYEDKKNRDPAHLAAEREGFAARELRNVEIDDDVDLDEYRAFQDELEARCRCGELPQVDLSQLELRLRKTGRHHALGLYFPQIRSVIVDPRAPRSLLHEMAHAYDHANGEVSKTSERFRDEVWWPFRRDFEGMRAKVTAYQKERLDALPEDVRVAVTTPVEDGEPALDAAKAKAYPREHPGCPEEETLRQLSASLAFSAKYSQEAAKSDYFTTPTEVFARSWEVYASLNGLGGSFVKTEEAYRADPAYAPLVDNAERLCAYFDEFARPRERAHLLTPEERAAEMLACDDPSAMVELRRMVAAGELDVAKVADMEGAAGERLSALRQYDYEVNCPHDTPVGDGVQMSIFDCLGEEGR